MGADGKQIAVLGALGVTIALGALVALSPKAEAAPTPPPLPPEPLPPNIPIAPPAPPQPAAPPAAPAASRWSHADAILSYADTPTEIRFRSGRRYRGRLDASSYSPTPADFARLGLSGAQVFVLPPQDWPPGVFAKATPATRWFEGLWAGPDANVPKPAAIEAVWVTTS